MSEVNWSPLTPAGEEMIRRRMTAADLPFDVNDPDESRHLVVNREVVESQRDVEVLFQTLMAERREARFLHSTLDLLWDALAKCRPFIEEKYRNEQRYAFVADEVQSAYDAMINAFREIEKYED